MARYWREAMRGEITLLCARCNKNAWHHKPSALREMVAWQRENNVRGLPRVRSKRNNKGD